MRILDCFLALALMFALTATVVAEETIATDLDGIFSTETQTETVVWDGDPYDADLVIGYVAQDAAQVNPFYCNETDLISANQLVFESLVTLDEEQKPVPQLADNWTHEGNTWVFNLRSGISFHDGAEMTAYDVVASYKAFIANKDTNAYGNRLLLFVSDMQALSDYQLQVTANYTGYLTLYAMDFPIVHASTVNDTLPRGTGPFWYIAYNDASYLRIEANPLWWKQQSTLSSITFRKYDSSTDALEAMHTKDIEMLATRSSSAAYSRKLSQFASLDYATTTYEFLLPNLSSSSVMSDVNVRKAVMYAMDRSTIVSNAYLDMAIQSEVPVLPGTWLYESQSAVYYYSPERALQLLYDSGWKDLTGDAILNKLDGIKLTDLSVNIITYNDSESSVRGNAAKLIADYLTTVGVKTTVEVLTRDTVMKRIDDRDYDLALIAVNLSEIPVLQPLLSSKGALNYNNYGNDQMDEYINLTATALTEDALKQVYSDIQMEVVDRLPILGLLFRTGTVLSTRSTSGMSGARSMHIFRGLEYLQEN